MFIEYKSPGIDWDSVTSQINKTAKIQCESIWHTIDYYPNMTFNKQICGEIKIEPSLML